MAPKANAEQKAEAKATAEAKEAAADVADTSASKDEPSELEHDAPADKRKRLASGAVAMSPQDATLNVVPLSFGNLFATLTEGGLQYLLAGIRATAGVKAGRYMFEVMITELVYPAEPQGSKGPQPRQLLRVGFSTAVSTLILGDDSDSICFDNEGGLTAEGKWQTAAVKFSKGQVLGVLLNLDPASPNANTISLFRDGKRVSAPKAIPEGLRGKALFPTVSFRNMMLHVNFGPIAKAALPFTCRMLADAATEDVEVAAPKIAKGGKPEVVFPVGLPESGFFDWVDLFRKQNPDYVELSDRSIAEWAVKSGVWFPRNGHGGSSDKPQLRFGVPLLDDLSARKVLKAIAPTVQRNFIVPELKGNLTEGERKTQLLRFGSADFKRKAVVLMGEPSADYREHVQRLVLADKQQKLDRERQQAAAEAERKRQAEERKRKAEALREEAAKKRQKVAAEKKAEGDEKEEEAKKGEEGDEVMEESKAEVEEKPEETAEPSLPETAELTEEEKAIVHRKVGTADVAEAVLARSLAQISMPSKAEGFDEVVYAWQKESESAKLLREWLLEKKKTTRAEDLKPGEWFKGLWTKWQQTMQEWRKVQNEFKDPAKRKSKQEAAKAKKEEEDKAEDGVDEAKGTVDVDVEGLDPLTVDSILDLGNGEPLFANFAFEDWTLLATRVELHLLLHAFKKDLNDADRPSFAETHLPFYYAKYFSKSFNINTFGCKEFSEFVELVGSVVAVEEGSGFLKPLLAEDTAFDTLMRQTEEERRERHRRIDAGDETAKLKFSRSAPAPSAQKGGQQGGARKSAVVGGGKGSKGGKGGKGSKGGGYSGGYGGGYQKKGGSYSSGAQSRAVYSGHKR